MTTKQILFSALILGATSNIVLAMEEKKDDFFTMDLNNILAPKNLSEEDCKNVIIFRQKEYNSERPFEKSVDLQTFITTIKDNSFLKAWALPKNNIGGINQLMYIAQENNMQIPCLYCPLVNNGKGAIIAYHKKHNNLDNCKILKKQILKETLQQLEENLKQLDKELTTNNIHK